MIGNGVAVDLGDAAFLRADGTGEIAEVIHAQRHVRIERFAYRFAVVPGLGIRQQFQILLDTVGDLEQHVGAIGGGGLAPRLPGRMRRIQRGFDIWRGRARDRGEDLAGDRRGVVEILTTLRRHPRPADEVVVAWFEDGLRVAVEGLGGRKCIHRSLLQGESARVYPSAICTQWCARRCCIASSLRSCRSAHRAAIALQRVIAERPGAIFSRREIRAGACAGVSGSCATQPCDAAPGSAAIAAVQSGTRSSSGLQLPAGLC